VGKPLLVLGRLLLNPKPIILLDEATSSLDLAAVELFEDVLLHVSLSATVIAITHQLHHFRKKFDTIVSVSDGRIVKQLLKD